MSAMEERDLRLSPLAETFLGHFQYAFSFTDRVAIGEAIFLKAVHTLYGSLTALLATQPEVVLEAKDGKVYLNGQLLPDSYVLQRVFVRFRCPGIRFRRGILLNELLQCVREIESVLKRETAPSALTTARIRDRQYEWIDPNQGLRYS